MTPKVREALKSASAVLLRRNKHHVFKLPNGSQVVVASTPSDCHAEQNALREIARRAAPADGRPRAERFQMPREASVQSRRRSKPGAPRPAWSLPVTTPMAQAFAQDATVMAHYADRVAALEQDCAQETARADRWASEYARVANAYDALRRSRWCKLGVLLGVIR